MSTVKRVEVYYEGWGESWHWGTLVSTKLATQYPQISFQYSDEAKKRKIELSSYKLPLNGPDLRSNFPDHQMGLPGPVYDAMPDGWGLLLMDRLFKQRGLNAARIGPLDRLTFVGSNALGAMTFVPVAEEGQLSTEDIPLENLASEVQEVQQGEGGAFLERLVKMGGSPQGARPKALLYRYPDGRFTTAASAELEPWLVKFPANQEHPEVCAIEDAYAACLRQCKIATPQTNYFFLPGGGTAFASKRFDRVNGMKVPMQSLAAFAGADFRQPGSLDYVNFLRATQKCTLDLSQRVLAFERAVFNVIFNNRDDHPKNFAFLMSKSGQWSLAPAYDVTFCEGPGGYHQMDIMGEALDIDRSHLIRLAIEEAEIQSTAAEAIIDRFAGVGKNFSEIAKALHPNAITKKTLNHIQSTIDENIARMEVKLSPLVKNRSRQKL
ncbi:type II toxin-antitoxin system HipA family toxin [Xanthomonas citri]|uniref:type II toxin-antitoxin system HipA family toxin n=1 Tax=Xanthomonas citri TaxID=346 RepID=UPI0002DC4441|nr:HipA domain-containing protein [Xanthomonas citri]